MAWLEQRGNGFRIKFRHSGQNLQCPLKAEDRKDAENCLARFEENYRLYLRGRLLPPADADLGIFLLSDGKLNHTPELKPTVTLGQLFDHYRTHHPEGVKEANTKKMEEYHMAHLERIIKKSTPLCEVNRQRLVENPAPTKGLLFAKEQVKPPFQTWEQIERQAKNPALSAFFYRRVPSCCKQRLCNWHTFLSQQLRQDMGQN